MILELPEDFFSQKGYSEKEFRIDTAILLFQRKVASLPRAAKVAGVTESEFEEVLKERHIFVSNKKETATERALRELAPDDPLRQVIKPLRKNVTAEELMIEQGYTGTNWERLQQLAKDMAIEEPIELLLAQLKE